MSPKPRLPLVLLGMLAIVLYAYAQRPEWGPPPPVAPYSKRPLPRDYHVLPMIFPVIGECHWKDGYGSDRGKFRHTGIDICGPKMSPIVAPFSGRIGIKRESFWIYGDNGWAMLGTHLNDDNYGRHDHKASMDLMFAPDLVPGQHVEAGQFIGYLGESGDATAPHLHFEIYAPGNGPTAARIRNPFPSLKAARQISHPIARMFCQSDKPGLGHLRVHACIRKLDPQHNCMTVILVSKQDCSGAVLPVTVPHYVCVKMSKQMIADVGGWQSLAQLPQTRPIALYLPMSESLDGASVMRINLGDPNQLASNSR